MPPSWSSSTLIGKDPPTTVPFKPTHHLSPCAIQDLTHTPLSKRLKRQLSKFSHPRAHQPAPILSYTLAFILLRDINGACPPPLAPSKEVSATPWSKLWIQSTGQPAPPATSPTSSSDICVLASVTDTLTLVATVKYWLLAGCTHRWPVGEPLVPLDVIARVHARMHKYGSCAAVQRAVEKRLERTQAADFSLVAAHVRGVVAMWPARAGEFVDEWAPVVTRVEEQVAKVRAGGGEDECVRVREMCWRVFRSVVNARVHDQHQGSRMVGTD